MIGTVNLATTLRACGSDGTTVACFSGRATKEFMSTEARLFDFLAAACNSSGNSLRKTIAKCARQPKRGILEAVGHCEEFDPAVVHRATMEEKDFIDKVGKGAVLFALGGSLSTRGPTMLFGYVLGGVSRSFVVLAVANTSTSAGRE